MGRSRFDIISNFDFPNSLDFYFWETKKVQLQRTDFPSCRLRFVNGSAHYYIKKRETQQSSGYDPLKYQFIASQKALVDNNDPLLQNDPAPSQGLYIPNRPNEFNTQYGWVFCERSRTEGMRLVDNRARQCGIEILLLSLCFQDQDVNPGPGRLSYINLGQTFGEDMGIRTLITDDCAKFIGVRLPPTRFLGSRNQRISSKAVGYYLKAAYNSGFDYVVSKYRCGASNSDPWEWRTYEIADGENRRLVMEVRRQTLFGGGYDTNVNTLLDFMYFCKRR